MKKELTTMLLSMFAAAVMAQETNGDNRLANIDWQEDSVEITTIKDIIRTQQAVTSRSATSAHYDKVWSKRGYFNLSYHTKSTMSPVETYQTGVAYNNGVVPTYKANWGASFMVGKNRKLHKKPIANMACFNLDFTFEANFDHFNLEDSVENGNHIYGVYDPNALDNDNHHYIPWNREKYGIGIGMSLGPSITLAPFNYIKGARGLHFLKFNVYYHVGYQGSFLFFKKNPEEVKEYPGVNAYKAWDADKKKTFKEDYLADNLFQIGHGLYQAIGFNVTWKSIGFGYEHRWSNGKKLTQKYKNVFSSDYIDNQWFKFETTTNRIYLTYRFGK